MTTIELVESLDDARLAPFLPMIAAVWEDGALTDLEIAAVCLAVIRRPGVDLTCKEALRQWLDPANPPSAGDLASLRARMDAPSRAPARALPTDLIGAYYLG